MANARASSGNAAGVRSLADPLESEEFRMGQLDRYSYSDDVKPDVVATDLQTLKEQWKARLGVAIADEAKQTDNWSLLWKMEAAMTSLDIVIQHAAQDFARAKTLNIGTAATIKARIQSLVQSRKDMRAEAATMFEDFKRWTRCGGKLPLPRLRPELLGFNHLSSRVVDWFALPRLSVVPTFPLQRQVMLFGPPASGKTVISNLAAYDLGERLKNAWIRGVEQALPGLDADDQKTLREIPASEFVIVYYVDALRERAADPNVVVRRLRNYLNCLQFEIVHKRREWVERRPTAQRSVWAKAAAAYGDPKPVAVFILDNLDSLFETDEDLKRQPRPMRQANQLRGYLYRQAADLGALAVKTPPNAAEIKAAAEVLDDALRRGGAVGLPTARLDGGMEQLLLNLLLALDWPDVRSIWSVRYPWKLPVELRRLVKGYELFVDLPNNELRASQFELGLKEELYRNLAAYIDERKALERERDNLRDNDPKRADIDAAIFDLPARRDDADEKLLQIEHRLRNSVESVYLARKAAWAANAFVAPLPYQIMASVIRDAPLASFITTTMAEYMTAMKPVIDWLVEVTGMSIAGYCQLQNADRISFSEVDVFLTTTGRRGDRGLSLSGATPFGFTLEDILRFQKEALNLTVDTRLLRAAINKSKAFVFGSQRWASPGCEFTARAVQGQVMSQKINADTFNLRNWLAAPENNAEAQTCAVALGPDLRDVSTRMPVLPLSARFGSHRLLKQDAVTALALFLPRVTPKPDYPHFVSYVLFGRENRNDRPPLDPSQISAVCRAQPGPAARLLQMSGTAPLPPPFTPVGATISPWRLYGDAPTVKFGGGVRPSTRPRPRRTTRLPLPRR